MAPTQRSAQQKSRKPLDTERLSNNNFGSCHTARRNYKKCSEGGVMHRTAKFTNRQCVLYALRKGYQICDCHASQTEAKPVRGTLCAIVLHKDSFLALYSCHAQRFSSIAEIPCQARKFSSFTITDLTQSCTSMCLRTSCSIVHRHLEGWAQSLYYSGRLPNILLLTTWHVSILGLSSGASASL